MFLYSNNCKDMQLLLVKFIQKIENKDMVTV
jgi:hypothetical protein